MGANNTLEGDRMRFAIIMLASVIMFGLTVGYDSPGYVTETEGEFTKLYVRGAEIAGQPGHPQLPVQAVSVLLPPDERAVSVSLNDEVWEYIGDYMLYPAQPPAILPMPGIEPPQFTQPDMWAYSQDRMLPTETLRLTGTGNMSGFAIAGMILNPIRHNPATGRTEILVSATIDIETAPSTEARAKPGLLSPESYGILSETVTSIVANPEDVQGYAGYFDIDPDAYDHIILVTEAYAPFVDPLCDLSRTMGLKDTVVLVERLVAEHCGADRQEMIRQGLRAFHTSYGGLFLTIAGDVESIPARWLWAMDSDAGVRDNENQLQADLYYSDLDGDYNADLDTIYGETTDDVDLYPDLFTGRITLGGPGDEGYFDKATDYALSPSEGYLDEMLFLAQILWEDPYTDSKDGKDMIDDDHVPDDRTITKLYESEGTESLENVMREMNDGTSIINHNGHGFWSIMGVGDHGYITGAEAMGMTNENKYGVTYSIGCWCAAYDYDDCIAENFVQNPTGGSVLYYGNSRYGWGSPGNPGWGYSDIFDRRFYSVLFEDNLLMAGAVLAATKAPYIPYSQWENTWRWHQYQLNLLGEPTLSIRTREPIVLAMSDLPETLPPGRIDIDVCFSADHGDLSGCMASVTRDGVLLDRGMGECVSLSFDAGAGGDIIVHGTGPDFTYIADTITIEGGRAYVVPMLGEIIEEMTPGTTREIPLHLVNIGDMEASIMGLSIDGDLTGELPLSIGAGDTADIALEVEIPEDAVDGQFIPIAYSMTLAGGEYTGTLHIRANAPQLEIIAVDVYCGIDGILEPGESTKMELRAVNKGTGTFPAGLIDILPGACSLTFTNLSDSPEVAPGDTAMVLMADLLVAFDYAGIPPLPFTLQIADRTEDFWLMIGDAHFSHDGEFSLEGFTEGGTGSHFWHVTDRRAYEGSRSIWCGNDGEGTYENNLDTWIETDVIYVDDRSTLDFDLYYNVTTYGSDGMYVYYIYDGDTYQLDYIGSGGALLPLTVGWAHYSYPLDVLGGSSVRIGFRMKTDGADVAEGHFLDNIEVIQQSVNMLDYEWSAVAEAPIPMPDELHLSVYPNPFNSTLNVDIGDRGRLSIKDISGRTVLETNAEPGAMTIDAGSWASGIYNITLEAENGKSTESAVLLK